MIWAGMLYAKMMQARRVSPWVISDPGEVRMRRPPGLRILSSVASFMEALSNAEAVVEGCGVGGCAWQWKPAEKTSDSIAILIHFAFR
jgi:hypothetical protein